jgi:hypothetical protein
MSDEFVRLEEASRRSGLHPNTLRRLLREGALYGYKAVHHGKQCWWVSAQSLKRYTNPLSGFLLDLPGPKRFLKRREEE